MTKSYYVKSKRRSDLTNEVVVDKANAAARWCALATKYASASKDKPWRYLLIPHDAIDLSMTLDGAAARFSYTLAQISVK